MKSEETHYKELFNLGLFHKVNRLEPNKLIFTFSNKILTTEDIDCLCHGLKFALPLKKINYYRWFLSFEKLSYKLKNLPIFDSSGDGFNMIRSGLKSIAFKYFYGFKPSLNQLHNKFYETLQNLRRDNQIIILKPDKGNGIVILNRNDYNEKMDDILKDRSKFKVVQEDWLKEIVKQEDKINRLATKLKNNKEINDQQYDFLHSSGSKPGILYGLPKVHKIGVPLRPILSAIGTSGYNIAKFLLPFLKPITTNIYTVQDSFSFVQEITNVKNSNSLFMASFDIKSLFTNIPLDETIEIATSSLYSDPMLSPSLSSSFFKQLLQLAVKNVLFIFNGKLFSQFDGVGMGNPLGPTLANVFLCFHE